MINYIRNKIKRFTETNFLTELSMTTFIGNNFTATIYKYYEPGVRLIETINGKEVVTDNYSYECKFCKNTTFWMLKANRLFRDIYLA